MCLLVYYYKIYFSTYIFALQMNYFYNSIDFFDKMCYNATMEV